MTFGNALEQVKAGYRIARTGWNGKNMHVYLQTPPAGDHTTLPYLVMFTAQGVHQPGWLASQADMLAEDWLVV